MSNCTSHPEVSRVSESRNAARMRRLLDACAGSHGQRLRRWTHPYAQTARREASSGGATERDAPWLALGLLVHRLRSHSLAVASPASALLRVTPPVVDNSVVLKLRTAHCQNTGVSDGALEGRKVDFDLEDSIHPIPGQRALQLDDPLLECANSINFPGRGRRTAAPTKHNHPHRSDHPPTLTPRLHSRKPPHFAARGHR